MINRQKTEDNTVAGLVRQAQGGDETAFSQLFQQYTPLMDSVCARHLGNAPSEQELRSAMMDAFWDAIRTYDTQQSSVTFGLYVKICLNHKIADCKRKWKRFTPMLSLDTDEIAEPGVNDNSNPVNYVIEQETYSELIQKMELLLSPKERRVWLLFVEGATASEIAKKLNIEKKDAENAIFRARKKLRQHILPHRQ